jgi:hypothetical protein
MGDRIGRHNRGGSRLHDFACVQTLYRRQLEPNIMSNPLLTLGPFSFVGLESPERIQLKTKQRLAVHHLGSGNSTIDYLGNDYETVSFRGIFSGTDAADRIRSIDHLRVLGEPLVLSWSSKALSVIIRQFELDYSSDLWIPYRLSCYVLQSINGGAADPTDVMSESPSTQVSDVIGLLSNSCINPTSGQTNALLTLATLSFDVPPPDALGQAQDLINAIDSQLVTFNDTSQSDVPGGDQGSPVGDVSYMETLVTNCGQQISLILGFNRVMSLITQAENISQQ